MAPITPDPTKKVFKAVVVYDRDKTPSIPSHVLSSRDKIEDEGIEFRITDTTPRTGSGTVPLDLRPALDAAIGVGHYPALICLDEDSNIIKAIKCPSTTQQIVDEVTK